MEKLYLNLSFVQIGHNNLGRIQVILLYTCPNETYLTQFSISITTCLVLFMQLLHYLGLSSAHYILASLFHTIHKCTSNCWLEQPRNCTDLALLSRGLENHSEDPQMVFVCPEFLVEKTNKHAVVHCCGSAHTAHC